MRRARGLAGLAIVIVLIASACGSNLTTEEIAAANGQVAGGPASGSGARVATAGTGTGSDAGVDATTGDVTASGQAATSEGSAAGRGSADGSPGDAAAAPATGEPIVLGNVGTYSGPVGSSLAGAREGLLAWAQHINATGGINGRPVEVRVADDGNDPARTLSLIKDMVERQGVVALVGLFSVMSTSSVRSYIESSGVPVIGGDLIDASWVESPSFFPQGSSFETIAGALAKLAADAGTRNIGILTCAESPLCELGARIVSEAAPRYGARVVYTAQITITAPDYTAQCLGAQSKDVDFLVVGADANTIGRVGTSCSRQGFTPSYAAPSISVTAALEGQPVLEGLVSAQSVFPWMATGSPGVDAFATALQTHAPGAIPSAATALAWTSGQLFAAAATRVEGDVTPASVMEAFNSIQGDDLGGLTVPLSFGAGQGHPQPDCYFPIQIVDGAFSAPNGTTPVCP